VTVSFSPFFTTSFSERVALSFNFDRSVSVCARVFTFRCMDQHSMFGVTIFVCTYVCPGPPTFSYCFFSFLQAVHSLLSSSLLLNPKEDSSFGVEEL